MLVDRRRSLGEEHTRKVSQLHALLLELLPGGAKKDLTAAQARALIAKVRPRDTVGKTRRRLAAELVGDLEQIYARKKAADKELKAWSPRPAPGCWTCTASDPPVPPGCWSKSVTSPGSPTATTSRPGPAPHPSTPPPATSCATACPAAGNRQINRALHMMAVVQLRRATEGRAYYDRKKATGKTANEAMRCLKRRLSDAVYRTMLDDLAQTTKVTGPGWAPRQRL